MVLSARLSTPCRRTCMAKDQPRAVPSDTAEYEPSLKKRAFQFSETNFQFSRQRTRLGTSKNQVLHLICAENATNWLLRTLRNLRLLLWR